MVFTKKLVVTTLAVSTLVFSMSIVGVASATQQTNPEKKKVTICHRTNSVTNPYRKITVSENAADGISGNTGPHADHYGRHKGPLAESLAKAQELKENKAKWGDIIPPVAGKHSGLNWTAKGQAIYNNNCNYVDYFMFEKDWKGDEVSLEGVKVTFDFKFNGNAASWNLGDAAVVVTPGDKLTEIKETVTGLPENCTSGAELVSEYTVPSSNDEDSYRKKASATGVTHTVPATNTVDCKEDTQEGETPQTSGRGGATPTPTTSATQVTSVPVGSVSAGGGGADTSSSALFGLLGSILALGLGIVRKVTI